MKNRTANRPLLHLDLHFGIQIHATCKLTITGLLTLTIALAKALLS